MHNDLEKIIADEKKIDEILTKIANRLNSDYMNKELLFIPVLTGSVFFAADLARRLTMPIKIECVKVSSYRNETVSGELCIELDTTADVSGKNVLLVEDIIDTGNTLSHMKKLFLGRGAASVKICTLLDKPSRRTADISADYIGMEIPNDFVVGYGLDYAEKYRNLPYIGILKKEIYA